jgi:predicted GNAT family acetyltransferase
MPVRQLGEAERDAVGRLLDRDPYAAAQVAERVTAHGLAWWRADGRIFGYGAEREPEALCWVGTHLTPVLAGPAAVAAFGDLLGGEPRRCSSIVGRADAVLGLWDRLRPHWGPDREVRPDQPLLLADAPPAVPGQPGVRLARPDDVDLLFPAAVAMYTEEVGVSPLLGDGGRGYRRRVAELVRARRAYLRIIDGEVAFKAELAVVTRHTAQVQGVWVAPRWRGRGLATTAMATVVGGGGGRGAAGLAPGGGPGAPPRRPDGQPVRQRLQHAGPPGVRPVRIPSGRLVRHGAVLTGAAGAAGAFDRRRAPGMSRRATGRPRRGGAGRADHTAPCRAAPAPAREVTGPRAAALPGLPRARIVHRRIEDDPHRRGKATELGVRRHPLTRMLRGARIAAAPRVHGGRRGPVVCRRPFSRPRSGPARMSRRPDVRRRGDHAGAPRRDRRAAGAACPAD